MSLLGYEGFDHYNNSTGLVTYQANFKPFSTGFGGGSGTQGVWAPTGLGGNLIFGAGLLGGQYMRSQSSNIEFGVALGASYGRLIFGVRFRIENAIANQGNIVTFRSAGGRQCGIGYNSTGKIVFWRNSFSTVIATGAITTLAQNSWYYLESDITFSSTATGAYTIRINGVNEITGSSVQTTNSSNTIDQFGLYYDGVTTNGVVIDWDDLYLLDPNTGSAPYTSFLGICRVETLFPTANDSVQFTPNASTNVSQIQETIIDGDSTFNSTSSTNQDTFSIGSLSTTPTTVFAVAVNAVMRADDVAAINAATVIKSGATTQAGVSNQQNTVYQVNRDIYVNDPNTGVAWLPTNVNAAKIGYKRI